MVKEFISQLPPDKLSPFAKHPYQVREDAAMDELIESIRTHGILSPLLARPKGKDYELRGEQYYPCLLPPESDTTEDKLLKIIIRQMAEAQGINEDLKARDQMAWVGAMNNIKSAALEIMRER